MRCFFFTLKRYNKKTGNLSSRFFYVYESQLSHKIRKTSVPSNFSAKEKLNFEKVILADSVLPRQNVRAVRPHRDFTPC